MKLNSRRGFLINTTLTGLGLLAGGSVNATFDRTIRSSPKRKIGVALLGLGGFATDSVAPEIASSKHVWLAGVITGDPDGKGKQWAAKYGFPEENIYHYDQISQIKNNPDIDFVHVVTPNGLHAKHTIAVARAGKHVLCEKPMAVNSAECRKMITECRNAGILLGIDYRLHWEPHHLKMVELIQNRTYGALKSIVTDFSWLRKDAKPWLLDFGLAGGGAFIDTGIYSVQAGCYLTGRVPLRVTAVPGSTRDVYQSGIEETMTVVFEFPDGVVMSSRASYAYDNHLCGVSSENGTFSCEGSAFAQSVFGKPSPKHLKLPRGESFRAENTLQIATIYDAFAESILYRKPFATTGEMGLRDTLVVEAVYRSAASGKTENIII
ncbi:MAG: Gfo/Idh/MocA family oxidoreductase [Prolixibacteraceae bacterium]|jgi:predicted dehydrogenase|nr:Gfo/Idh/MocA family oxidoreductase [Prolixibacteraceae bacterium]